MTIRLATPADLDAIVTLGEHFLAESTYRPVLAKNPAQMRALATRLIETDDGDIFVAARDETLLGMFGAFVFAHPISGELVASEVFWYVDPVWRGVGLRLLYAAQRWARARGAVVLQLIAPTPDVATLYEKLGYIRIETLYQRRIA